MSGYQEVCGDVCVSRTASAPGFTQFVGLKALQSGCSLFLFASPHLCPIHQHIFTFIFLENILFFHILEALLPADILPYKLKVAYLNKTGWSGHSMVSFSLMLFHPVLRLFSSPVKGGENEDRHALFLIPDNVSDSSFSSCTTLHPSRVKARLFMWLDTYPMSFICAPRVGACLEAGDM